jgi:hypothetical protein
LCGMRHLREDDLEQPAAERAIGALPSAFGPFHVIASLALSA